MIITVFHEDGMPALEVPMQLDETLTIKQGNEVERVAKESVKGLLEVLAELGIEERESIFQGYKARGFAQREAVRQQYVKGGVSIPARFTELARMRRLDLISSEQLAELNELEKVPEEPLKI